MAWILQQDYPVGTSLGSCYICKTGRRYNGERLLDPQIQIDFEGWLVICEECIAEAARLLGMISTDQAVALQETVDQMAQVADDATADANEAHAALAAHLRSAAAVKKREAKILDMAQAREATRQAKA